MGTLRTLHLVSPYKQRKFQIPRVLKAHPFFTLPFYSPLPFLSVGESLVKFFLLFKNIFLIKILTTTRETASIYSLRERGIKRGGW
jgi:hypothetical protein